MNINAFPNYTIDVDGSIKNINTGVVRSTYVDKQSGYEMTRLWKDGKGVQQYIHRLVAIHYIPNPNQYNVVHHKDGNILNNHADNLYWGERQRTYRDDHNIYKRKIRFHVIVKRNGKSVFLGSASTLEEARKLRDSIEEKQSGTSQESQS